jgi:hypothetical protein
MRMKRFKRRSAAILALAVAGAVAVAGVALASGESTVTVNFTPSALPPPGTGYTSGKLNVHTHTAYTNPGNANPGGATDRAQLYFDDDFRLNTNAVPKCRTSQLSGNITMKTAMARCGPSRVSTSTAPLSTAQASVDGLFNVNGCVLVFNGASSTGEVLLFTRVNVADPPNNNITCGSAASNEQGNTSILLKGDLKANPSPQGADFADPDNCSAPVRNGCQLDINNITDSADLPLTDFNAYIQKGSFIAARCDDTPKALNLKVKFTYNDGTFDNRSASKACT